jgi:hypothetical protein
MLGVNQSMLVGWIAQGLLTPMQELGRALYFNRDEVWSFIARWDASRRTSVLSNFNKIGQ